MKDTDRYIITGVPHVSGETEIYCHFASITMLLKYLGIKTNIYEVMYLSGVGHSLASRPRILKSPYFPALLPSLRPMIACGLPISQGKKDFELLGKLFGLSVDYQHPTHYPINKKSYWAEYWRRIKYYIKQNIPVYTGVDPFVWPVYKESWNWNNSIQFHRAGHSIVLVGFDDERNIYYNDPYDMRIGTKKCAYASIPMEHFINAVSRAFFSIKMFNFLTLTFRKVSEPLSNEEVLKIVNSRNIERMKGNQQFYDDELCLQSFYNFGMNAMLVYREDLNRMKTAWEKIFYKFLTYFKYPSNPFEHLTRSAYQNSVIKKDISNYLFKHKSFAIQNKKEAIKLRSEAEYWEHLGNLYIKLNAFIKHNPIQKVLTDTPLIIQEIIEAVDNIIFVENNIIYSQKNS